MNADGIIIRRVSIHHIVIDAKGLSRDTKTVRTVTNCPRESAAGRQAGRQTGTTAHCGIQKRSQQRISHVMLNTVLQQFRDNDERNSYATGANGRGNSKIRRQWACNVTFRRVRTAIVVVEKQPVLHILSVCL